MYTFCYFYYTQIRHKITNYYTQNNKVLFTIYKMSDRICIKCNKVFDAPCRLKAHLNRKKTCELLVLIDNTNNKFKCKFCNKSFVSNISMYRHIRLYCKIALTNINKTEIIQLNIQNQITQLSNTVNILLKKENIPIQNVQNIETQNIQNNNITINCTIVPFSDMVVKNDNVLNPFLKENSAAYEYANIPLADKIDVKNNDANNQLISSALVEMVENIYSESENRNIYLLKLHECEVMVYQKDGIWCVKLH